LIFEDDQKVILTQKYLNSMVADLRHVIFSLLRLKMRECTKTRGRQSWTMLLLPVFSFSGIRGKKGKYDRRRAKIRHIKAVVFSHYMMASVVFSLFGI
jgi:hypothetical protein